MKKFKYTPGSWVKMHYNKSRYSGCSLKFANTIDKKRGYINNPAFSLTVIPITAHFKIEWLFAGHMLPVLPLPNKHQHLTTDDDIDYESFISLN